VRPWCLRRFLRSGLVELDRSHDLLDVLDLEQPALMLVMGAPGIGSPTLGRLAVPEVEKVRLRLSSMSSSSEHGWNLRGFAWAACAFGYLSLRSIGDLGLAENPPIR